MSEVFAYVEDIGMRGLKLVATSNQRARDLPDTKGLGGWKECPPEERGDTDYRRYWIALKGQDYTGAKDLIFNETGLILQKGKQYPLVLTFDQRGNLIGAAS